ncbi:hypothetical protein BLGI_1961 [Brevibacillus laterosporus GI-9]|nr:hypothetical protein BLGI_1961 [Brevibacillus laterosporus GI-9]
MVPLSTSYNRLPAFIHDRCFELMGERMEVDVTCCHEYK